MLIMFLLTMLVMFDLLSSLFYFKEFVNYVLGWHWVIDDVFTTNFSSQFFL